MALSCLPMASAEARSRASGLETPTPRARRLWALVAVGVLLAHTGMALVAPRGRAQAAIEARAALRAQESSRQSAGRTTPATTAHGKTTC